MPKEAQVLSQKTRCCCPLFTGSLIPGPSISQMNLIQSTGTSCRGTGSKGLERALGNPPPGSTSLISLGSLPGPWQLLGARYFCLFHTLNPPLLPISGYSLLATSRGGCK